VAPDHLQLRGHGRHIDEFNNTMAIIPVITLNIIGYANKNIHASVWYIETQRGNVINKTAENVYRL